MRQKCGRGGGLFPCSGASLPLFSIVHRARDIFCNHLRWGWRRWHAIGAVSVETGVGAVLLVVHAYREDFDGEEIIRIISAGRADKNEYRRYQEQEVD